MSPIHWFLAAGALALSFHPGSAAAQDAGRCHATPQETRKSVPWSASSGEIPFNADQSECKVKPPDLHWMVIAVLPPGTTPQRILKYSIDTNFSSRGRTGKIQLGDASIEIEQEPGPAPGMSYTPGRMEFACTAGKNNPADLSKSLFVASGEPLVFSAKADPVPWLKIKPQNTGARKREIFQVLVDPKKLKPGAYTANIYLEAQGASNPKAVVPVVMQIGQL